MPAGIRAADFGRDATGSDLGYSLSLIPALGKNADVGPCAASGEDVPIAVGREAAQRTGSNSH